MFRLLVLGCGRQAGSSPAGIFFSRFAPFKLTEILFWRKSPLWIVRLLFDALDAHSLVGPALLCRRLFWWLSESTFIYLPVSPSHFLYRSSLSSLFLVWLSDSSHFLSRSALSSLFLALTRTTAGGREGVLLHPSPNRAPPAHIGSRGWPWTLLIVPGIFGWFFRCLLFLRFECDLRKISWGNRC